MMRASYHRIEELQRHLFARGIVEVALEHVPSGDTEQSLRRAYERDGTVVQDRQVGRM